MGRRPGPGLTPADKDEIWRRWGLGQSMEEIGRALDHRRHPTIFKVLAKHGGIKPAVHRRAPITLTLVEREDISRGMAAGQSIRCIAKQLGRAPSTVSREVARHGGRRAYRAAEADGAAWASARRPKACRLSLNPALRQAVARKLSCNWSPKQISGWLRDEYPADEAMHVSHETIYRSLFIQARGALKRELIGHLRSKRSVRRSRQASNHEQSRGQIVDAISIRERPAEAEDRAVPGHWEGDLLCGSKRSFIVTLVERHSRFVMLIKVPDSTTDTVVAALSRSICKLPATLKRSLTWDRGHEMAAHKAFTVATDVQVYFCDPHSPWQRGSNENTNGLLRQYFPKRTDLSVHSQAHLNKVALQLNQRPRETLGFKTPAYKLNASVAATR